MEWENPWLRTGILKIRNWPLYNRLMPDCAIPLSVWSLYVRPMFREIFIQYNFMAFDNIAW